MGAWDVDHSIDETMGVPEGDRQTASKLLPLMYDQLKAIARDHLSHEGSHHSFEAADLVHEAYLRLAGGADFSWAGRSQFFFAATKAMRRILIDHARRCRQLKRGGGRLQFSTSTLDVEADDRPLRQSRALEEALLRLEHLSPGFAAAVRLRFYGGLTINEVAKTLGRSPRTIKREWTCARAWLLHELGDGE